MPETERFGLRRKIIANITSEGWRNAPHASLLYEANVTDLLRVLKEINRGKSVGEAITFNTAMLKIIAEGIKSCPKINGHIRFNRLLLRGRVTTFGQIDVTVPTMIERDKMMALKLPDIGSKSLSEIRDTFADLMKRASKTHLPQVMFDVAIHDTVKELKRFRIIKALSRLFGLLIDGTGKELLHGEEKRRYRATPATERLTWRDLEQGTVMVSNPGSLMRDWNGECVIMDLVPPQIAAFSINPIRDQAIVDKDGSIVAAKIAELTAVFDHRALDGSDLVPFVKKVEEIISNPEILKDCL